MFAKLLKQHWRSTRGVLGLLCAIILISGVALGLSVRFLTDWSDTAQWLETVFVIVVMFCFLAVGICCASGLIYLLYHYYQTRFTDQGYLTFTLPVSQHQLLLSGVTGVVLGNLLVLLTAAVAVALAMGIMVLSIPENLQALGMLRQEFGMLWHSLWEALGSYGGTLLKFVGLAVVFGLSEVVLLMLAVTCGALIAKKHPLLMTAVVYYGIRAAQTVFYGIVTASTFLAGTTSALLTTMALTSLAILLGGYFLMYHLTSRKLNLT